MLNNVTIYILLDFMLSLFWHKIHSKCFFPPFPYANEKLFQSQQHTYHYKDERIWASLITISSQFLFLFFKKATSFVYINKYFFSYKIGKTSL